MRIALHTQDRSLTRQVAHSLEGAATRCVCFGSAEGALQAVHKGGYDIAVVDDRQHLEPDESLLAWLRCRAAETTVVVLRPDADPTDTIRLLEAGADHVFTGHVIAEVLAALVRALQRRLQRRSQATRLELGGFRLDRNAGTISDRGREVMLTPREFDLAWFLFSNPSNFASRATISLAVWGVQAEIAEHTIEQHIYMLRRKLCLKAQRGVWIRAGYGRGYRLETRAAEKSNEPAASRMGGLIGSLQVADIARHVDLPALRQR